MANFPVRPRTLKKLQEMATPQSVPGGNSEAVPWELFSCRTYDSAATTSLRFFDSAPSNPRLGNVGPSLPSPQYFEVFYAYLTIFAIPGATAAIDDIWLLTHGVGTAGVGTPTWTFTLADKALGPFPLQGLHTRGGVTGGNAGAAATSEWGSNAETTGNGTFCFDGSLMIPPTQNFSVDIQWPAPVTLAGGDTELCVSLAGVLHRRIL